MNYKIPYLVGNRTPQDHTQFYSYDLQDVMALHISLVTLMALAWRIREFTFSGSIAGKSTQHYHSVYSDFSNSGVPPTPTVATLDAHADVSATVLPLYSRLPGGSGPAEDEIDVTFSNSGWVNTWGNAPIAATGEYSWDSDGSPPWVPSFHDQATLAAPFVSISGDAGYDETSPEKPFIPSISCGFGGQQFLTGSTSPYGGDGFFTLDPVIAPGFTIPMAVFVGRPVGIPGSGVGAITLANITEDSFEMSELSANFTAIATKFWPYKTKSGQPVYDESSGAQLNDPFS